MKVWVIMGNDFPDAVRLTKAEADAYVAEKQAEDAASRPAGYAARIYWRAYEFDLPGVRHA